MKKDKGVVETALVEMAADARNRATALTTALMLFYTAKAVTLLWKKAFSR